MGNLAETCSVHTSICNKAKKSEEEPKLNAEAVETYNDVRCWGSHIV
jgi:hypothetical protein